MQAAQQQTIVFLDGVKLPGPHVRENIADLDTRVPEGLKAAPADRGSWYSPAEVAQLIAIEHEACKAICTRLQDGCQNHEMRMAYGYARAEISMRARKFHLTTKTN